MHGAQDTVTGGFVGAHLGATDVTGKPSRPSALLQTQRAQHAARLGAGFVEFVPRLGVGDDAGAGAEAKLRTLDLRAADQDVRSEEHTSELQSLMRISYAVFCLKKKNQNNTTKQKAVNIKKYIRNMIRKSKTYSKRKYAHNISNKVSTHQHKHKHKTK